MPSWRVLPSIEVVCFSTILRNSRHSAFRNYFFAFHYVIQFVSVRLSVNFDGIGRRISSGRRIVECMVRFEC